MRDKVSMTMVNSFRAMIVRRRGNSLWRQSGRQPMSIRDSIRRLAYDENGAALIEYTTLIGIVIVVALSTILVVGGWVGNQWTMLLGLFP
jgi:pilus assembly protein Flp/PilA